MTSLNLGCVSKCAEHMGASAYVTMCGGAVWAPVSFVLCACEHLCVPARVYVRVSYRSHSVPRVGQSEGKLAFDSTSVLGTHHEALSPATFTMENEK